MAENIRQCKVLNRKSKSQFHTYNAYLKMPADLHDQLKKNLPAKYRESLTACEC